MLEDFPHRGGGVGDGGGSKLVPCHLCNQIQQLDIKKKNGGRSHLFPSTSIGLIYFPFHYYV